MYFNDRIDYIDCFIARLEYESLPNGHRPLSHRIAESCDDILLYSYYSGLRLHPAARSERGGWRRWIFLSAEVSTRYWGLRSPSGKLEHSVA